MFPLRHTWPVLTPFIHIIRNTRFRGLCCSWIKVERQKDSMGTDSWYIEGLVLSGGWSVLHCKEFVQCQSVKAASKPTVIFFLERIQILINLLASCEIELRCQWAGLEMSVSFLWHCIDIIIVAFSGKLVRWPFLSCFSKLRTESEWKVFCVTSGHSGIKGCHCLQCKAECEIKEVESPQDTFSVLPESSG